MNLRLGTEAERALREAAQRTGRSQQDLLREAVDAYLGLVPVQRSHPDDPFTAAGLIGPPRIPFRNVAPTIEPPPTGSTLDLLDRGDRF